MRFFEWFSRVPTDGSEVPTIKGDFELALLDAMSEEELIPLNAEPGETTDSPLSGLFLHIEYEGLDGDATLRPVTIKDEYRHGEDHALIAMCHQSNAIKRFRLGRIRAVVSVDGLVYRPAEDFWTLIGYAPPSGTQPTSPESRGWHSASDIRSQFRHEIRVLGALAGADGHLHDKEVGAILEYLWDEVALMGSGPGPNAESGLAEHIKRLRVTRDCLDDSLGTLFAGNGGSLKGKALERFLNAARGVVDADGVFHTAEFEFLDYLEAVYLDENWDLLGDATPSEKAD